MNKFFLSKNYICKHFKKIMNCTIIEYQTSLRIEQAKKLCYYTNKPLNQIATSLGFKTEQYFISCFKRKYPLSTNVTIATPRIERENHYANACT